MLWIALSLLVCGVLAFVAFKAAVDGVRATWRVTSLRRSQAIRYAAKCGAGMLLPAMTREEQGPDYVFNEWSQVQTMPDEELQHLRWAWRVLSGLDRVSAAEMSRADMLWSQYGGSGVSLPPLSAAA